MAKKTKKNNVVKKAVKAAKPAKKSKAAPAKSKPRAKAKPVKSAAKKAAKPVVKKAVKNAKAAVKKRPAKGNNKAASKAVTKKNKRTAPTKQAKAVKKASPAKPVKVAKPARTAGKNKATKPSKPAAKAPAAPKVIKKTAPASRATATQKKAADPVTKAAVKPVNGAPKPVSKSKKNPAPAAKAVQAKPIKDEEEEIQVDEVPELIDGDIPEADASEDIAPIAPVKPKSKGRVNGKGKAAQSGPRVITAPITPPKPQVMPADKKKEPKGRFEMEYVVHASAYLLFEFLTTPSGLSEWFADDVNIRQGIYTFFWDGSEQQAKLIGYKDVKLARFQWLDKNDGSYFEFRIEVDDLTGDVSLIITDFAEDPAEMATTKLLWDSQVNKLLHVIGAYY